MGAFIRGSEWRKWDLHVHTPESVLNNEYGDDWDKYVKTIFNEAIKNKISAIGITDYFSIDGYKKIVNDYLNNEHRLRDLFSEEINIDSDYLDKVKSILILPNIEFRIDKVVKSKKDGPERRLNYHVIFSNNVSIVDIEENFLHNLDIHYQSTPTDGIETRKLKKCNIIELGKKLKGEQESFRDKTDYFIGCMNTYVEITEIEEILKKNSVSLFKDKHLLILADDYISLIDWNGQGHNVRKILCSLSNMVFSTNANTIKWGLENNTEKEFGSKKPCIWGSDAHSYEKLFIPDNEAYCWIKSDTTFEGLLQVLNEPSDRVYIGKRPEKIKIVDDNKSHYIDSIYIKKTVEYTCDDWFNNSIQLNSGLVAVIGNKGSGKSAFADILGLVSNSKNQDYFSFLNKDRFGKMPENLAQYFESSLLWYDGCETGFKPLSVKVNTSEVERVKYLPQKYIENVCNDLGDEFVQEINKMIFSYLPETEKLGKRTFSELINYLCSSIDDKIDISKIELQKLNNEIIALENKSIKEYRDTIKNEIKSKINEIIAHKKLKPETKDAPDNFEYSEENKKLFEIDCNIKEIEEQIRKEEELLKRYNIFETDFNHIKEKINDIKDKYDKTHLEIKQTFEKYEIKENVEEIIELKINNDIFKKYMETITVKKKQIYKLLEQDKQKQTEDSLYRKKEILLNDKTLIITKVNSETRDYQNYLDELQNWKNRKKELIGAIDKNESFKYLMKEYRYLKKYLKNDLKSATLKRGEVTNRIYESLAQKVNYYKDIYKYAIECLREIGEDEQKGINFSVDILAKNSTVEDFLNKINQGVVSLFQGKSEGYIKMKEIVAKYNFNNFEDVSKFIDEIYSAIIADMSRVNKLVKNRNEFYDLLFSLDYLKIEYKLRLGNKYLEQLSPGEKGGILLLFYLALDRENCPLIIDQPEDNLDNQSVFEKLVPFIRKAKKKRQVIIVTHNPNIAVACDAEQIIYSEINKIDNKVLYESGSIENPKINKRIVDVLEGTLPAFILRKIKYIEVED